MLAGNWLVGLPPEYLGEYVPKIRAVEAAQVQAMARKYYDPENQSIVVVGDAAADSEQLKPSGAFEVRENSRVRAGGTPPAHAPLRLPRRSEERGVWKECVRTVRSWR